MLSARIGLCAGVVLMGAALLAQTRAGDARPAFEVATIKLAAATAAPKNQVLRPSPNRVSIPSMTLSALIYAAYGNGGFNTSMRVTGGPDWVNKTAFAVEGLAAETATLGNQRLMLQALLEERFALKIRTGQEIGEVFALEVDRRDGKLGPKVKPWEGTCPEVAPALMFPAPRRPLVSAGDRLVPGPASESDDPEVAYCPTGYRVGGLRIDGATMRTVAEILSLPPSRVLLGTIVHDHTGLSGRYTMDLDFVFTGAPPVAAAGGGFAGPLLEDAVREQWGLKLVRSRGPLNVVVVESAQLPAEN